LPGEKIVFEIVDIGRYTTST